METFQPVSYSQQLTSCVKISFLVIKSNFGANNINPMKCAAIESALSSTGATELEGRWLHNCRPGYYQHVSAQYAQVDPTGNIPLLQRGR